MADNRCDHFQTVTQVRVPPELEEQLHLHGAVEQQWIDQVEHPNVVRARLRVTELYKEVARTHYVATFVWVWLNDPAAQAFRAQHGYTISVDRCDVWLHKIPGTDVEAVFEGGDASRWFVATGRNALTFTNCNLTRVPPPVLDLRMLTELIVCFNPELAELPRNIGWRLPLLRALVVRNNPKLVRLPLSIIGMPQFDERSTYGSPVFDKLDRAFRDNNGVRRIIDSGVALVVAMSRAPLECAVIPLLALWRRRWRRRRVPRDLIMGVCGTLLATGGELVWERVEPAAATTTLNAALRRPPPPPPNA